jgi:hypothetical protein
MMKRLLTSLALFVVASLPLMGQLTFLKEGQLQMKLQIAPNDQDAAKVAVQHLTNYVKKSTGADLQTAEAEEPNQIRLRIQPDLDREAFTFTFPTAGVMVISGGGNAGLEFAAYEFLERYLGVRWLMPGEVGEYIPVHRDLTIPAQAISQTPSFLSRTFSGSRGQAGAWMRKMRANPIRVEFHHNLWRLFPVEELGAEHPEFYPLLENKRYVPPKEDQIQWQPCFTAPGSAEAAAERIKKYWRQKPNVTSYSLGVNDSARFCTCATCQKVNGGTKNFGYFDHITPSFTLFANRLAELLRPEFPDHKLGFLSYFGLLEPATESLDPALVPFMTFDRMMWLDQSKEEMGKEMTLRWKEKVPHLGWYDYIYGRFYDVPRIYFHHMADYLRWGYEHGVRHYYAEYYPSLDWHEGPKFYLAMKLCWDINLDVDALLDEWYNLAVGPEAAPILKEYFTRLEDFWTTRAIKTAWFNSNGLWLPFKRSDYMVALTIDEVAEYGQLLDQMVAKSTYPARAEFIRQSYRNWQKNTAGLLKRYDLLQNPEKLDYQPLTKIDYDGADPKISTWQRDYSRGSFKWSVDGGRDGTGAVYIGGTGSGGTPMCYMHYFPIEKPQIVQATVWFKTEDVAPQTTVSIDMRWQAATSKGANAPDPQWRAADYNTSAMAVEIKPGQWQQLKVNAISPPEIPCRLTVLLLTDATDKGKIYFDDLELQVAPWQE